MEETLEEKLEVDIRREFQLERMILFSDAVFAIVITLMAIDIKVPEAEKKYTSDELLHHVKLLIPTILAYAVSFVVIGITWYRHLQIFGRLKDYDKGLVICNLVLLFSIGLFPFGASMVSHPNNILLPYIIYFIVTILTMGSQNFLHYYIFYIRPTLLHSPPTGNELIKVKKGMLLVAAFCISMVVVTILYYRIENPEAKPFAMMALFLVPICKKILDRKMKVKEY